ncbi:MAG: methionyl-tRNA formyltransferase [Phycisphaerae bacterium]|nr:methionyl-tRNA formyltransferase [Phycisphaerae bacterium]
MRIVYFGSSSFGLPSLETLRRSEHQVVGVFTQPARSAGRHKTPRPTAVADWARTHGVPCAEAADINAAEMREAVAACRADLLVVIAFGQKIGSALIEMHPKGAINVHASLLPKYRGAAPVNWAIINGETESGVSIITLADRMDAGFILGEAAAEISPDETAESLHDRLAELGAPLLLKTVDQIAAGVAVYRTQDEAAVTFAPKLKKSDGNIDWSRPAEEIANRARGLWPWPGAQTDYASGRTSKCTRVTIALARAVAYCGPDRGAFGRLNADMNVICGAGALEIVTIKPAGGDLMAFKDFINGRSTQPGDVFLSIEGSGG